MSLPHDSETETMSAERTEELSKQRVTGSLPVSISVSVSEGGRHGTDTTHDDAAPAATRSDATRSDATNGGQRR